jgi:hypothetical protein
MTRLRFGGSTWLAFALAVALLQAGQAHPQSTHLNSAYTVDASTDAGERCYKIYSLDEMGDDPGFGEWIASTIPEVIASGTWKGPGVIRYYAPKNILVVCHTAAVQAKVDAFLKDVKKSMPGEKKATAAMRKVPLPGLEVVPASYRAPALLKAYGPSPEPSLSYPVPTQAKPPKHLFHFIIRYEGEGIIDDSVVKAMKAYIHAEKKANEAAATAPAASAPVTPASLATPSTSTVTGSTSSNAAPATKDKEEKKEDKKDKEKQKEKTEEP